MRKIVVVLLLALLPWSGATALDRDRTLDQFHHTGWTLKDGAPPDIWALAQTADGFLWLGTGAGLYRFDGMKFERQQAPLHSTDITALLATSDSALWIGCYFGGATLLRDGRYTLYTEREGMPAGIVFRFAETGDGAVWAAASGGLGRWQDGHWQSIGADWHYPAAAANWVLVDRQGILWVSTGSTIVFLRPGAHAFEATGEHTGVAVLAQAPGGRIWISDASGGTRVLPDYAGGHPPSAPAAAASAPVQAKRLLFDRDGSLWATDTAVGGVFRLSEPERLGEGRSLRRSEIAEVYGRRQGLTADIAVPILEDREGSIWVGTNLGLNRFRRNPMVAETRIADVSPFGFALAAGDDGVLWVAAGGALSSITPEAVHTVKLPLPRISCLYRAADGGLWLGGPGHLMRLEHGRLLRVELPPQAGDEPVQAMVQDGAGGLWVSFGLRGLYRLWQGRWLEHGGRTDLPAQSVLTLAADGAGRVWLGYADGRVALLDGGSLRLFGPEQGLQVGNVMSIDAGGAHALVGGELGVAQFDGQRFRSLTSARAEAFSGITGLAESAGDTLWLNGMMGVLRIDTAELQRALDDPAYSPRYQLFNDEDGLPGVAQQANPLPTTVAAGGRLWFATNRGLAWTDPARLSSNAVLPPVAIEAVSANGRRYAPAGGLRLPQRTGSVQIDYTALSLVVPERVRFRYRLDQSEGWEEADTRRQASYSNLGPGPHRFRVIAANNDGLWNESGAVLDFSIEPAFYQTGWFKALGGVAAFALLWLVYLLRLRQMTWRLQARLQARYEERERIARELHDTLLQSVQGLILRFHAVAQRIAKPELRQTMEQTLDHADAVLEEARDRVRALRTRAHPVDDLATAFAAIGRELAQGGPVAFNVEQLRAPRMLDPLIRDEIFQLGREALSNAFQHAGARAIEVEISYGRDELRLRVRDDGRGIDRELLQAGGRPGHWGLPGMRERAQRIKAQLDIWSGNGLGTEVELRVPADVAYCGRVSRAWWLKVLGRAVTEDVTT